MVISERGEIFYMGEWKECSVCKMPHPPKITARHEAKELRKRERIASLLKKVWSMNTAVGVTSWPLTFQRTEEGIFLYPESPTLCSESKRSPSSSTNGWWHGCPKCYTRPKTNRAFWDRKREQNIARDKRVNRQLRRQGWKVIRIWQLPSAVYAALRLSTPFPE